MKKKQRKWAVLENRVKAVRTAVKRTGKAPKEIRFKDLKDNGLGALIQYCSLHVLLLEAGYEVLPWELSKVPHGFWDDTGNRSKAIRWLLETTDKAPAELRTVDLRRNGLLGLWQYQRKMLKAKGRSPSSVETMYELLRNARLDHVIGSMAGLSQAWRDSSRKKRKRYNRRAMARFKVWLSDNRERVPDRKMAREMIRTACRMAQKIPEDLVCKDFIDAGYVFELRAAGGKGGLFDLADIKVPKWKMARVPANTWKDPKNRIEAVRWLIEVTGKAPYELTKKDFWKNGLGSLTLMDLGRLLEEAGHSVPPHLLRGRRDRWDRKEDRIEAVRWLARHTGKAGQELTDEDFQSNGLWTLWECYHPFNCKHVTKGDLLAHGEGWLLEYKNPALRAAAEAGLLDRSSERRAKERYPPTKYGTRSTRVAAIRRAVRSIGKRPEALCLKDLQRAGLTHLMNRYYGNNIIATLEDAGYELDKTVLRPKYEKGKWKVPERRIRAVRRFVRSTGLPPEKLTAVMFCKAGLGSLLSHKNFWNLLREAGYDILPWKMASVPTGFWKARENRAWAVRWLIDELGIHPAKLSPKHFRTNSLFGLWQDTKRKKREHSGQTSSSNLVLAQLLEDAGLKLAARSMRHRKSRMMRD